MSRAEQIELIEKGSVIITIGVVAVVLASGLYHMMPSMLRIFVAPALLGAAWFFAKRIVTPVLVTRFDHYLNRDFEA